MSGGHFNYENYKVNEWLGIVRDDILQEDVYQEWKNEYTEEQLLTMKKFHKLLMSVSHLLNSYDYAISGDIDLNSFVKDYKNFEKESFI